MFKIVNITNFSNRKFIVIKLYIIMFCRIIVFDHVTIIKIPLYSIVI